MLDGSGNVVVKDGPTTIMSTPQSSLSSLTINGNGGANTLTVDESNGILSIPVTFNGGGAGGMTVTGYSGVQVTDTYTGTGPGHSGTVQIGAGGLISYTGLAPLSLSGTASDLIIDLSQTGVANTDVVVGDDGTLADPDATNDVNASAIYSASNAFEYTQFTNPTNSLTVKTGSLGDTVTLAALDSAFAAAAVNLNGTAGAEVFNIEATPASATSTVTAGDGFDTINVSSNGAALTGNLDGIDGLLRVDAGATASDVLNISESGSATADTVTVTATSYAGTSGGGWNIQEINFGFSGGVHLSLGSAGDTVQVLSMLNAQALTIDGNGGADVFNVSSNAPTNTGDLLGLDGLLAIDGGAGSNTLNVSESGSSAADTVLVTSSQISSAITPFTINYSATGGTFAGGINLFTGSVGDTVNVQSTLAGGTTSINTGGGRRDQRLVQRADQHRRPARSRRPPRHRRRRGGNTLNVSESGSAAADTVLVTSSQISSVITPFSISYSATGGTFGGGVNLSTGSAGDTINVQSTLAGGTTSINAGAGADVINVSSNAPLLTGNLDGIAGQLNIDAQGGANTLNVSDFSSFTANSNVTLTNNAINGMAGPADATPINYLAAGGDFSNGINVYGSNNSGDGFNVLSTLAGGTTSIFGEGGNDNFANILSGVDMTQLQGPLDIDGGAGNNDFAFSDRISATGVTATLTNSLLTSTGWANISYTNLASFYFESSSADDTVNVLSTLLGTNYILGGDGGSDTFTIGNTTAGFATPGSGSLSGIQGHVTVLADDVPPAGTSDTLNVDASADPALNGPASIGNVGGGAVYNLLNGVWGTPVRHSRPHAAGQFCRREHRLLLRGLHVQPRRDQPAKPAGEFERGARRTARTRSPSTPPRPPMRPRSRAWAATTSSRFKPMR